MVSTPEGFTDNSPRSPIVPTPVNKPSARKSLCLFTNILDVEKKTATRQVRDAKPKRKLIKYETTPWALEQKTKRKLKNQQPDKEVSL